MLQLALSLVLLFGATRLPATVSFGATTQQGDSAAAKPGKVKGIVTYYFNSNFGEKPDIGSKVFLVEGGVDIPPKSTAVATKDDLYIDPGSPPLPRRKISIIDQTIVDANGAFNFEDVPSGVYTVVILSSHSRSRNVEAGFRDALGRWQCIAIEVKSGRSADASHGFPASN
jgi:hypothetical protein